MPDLPTLTSQPLHHACANGALEEALRVLVDDNVETIDAVDVDGRTPLHVALGNADHPTSPGVVGLLLSRRPAAANAVDAQGNLPVHLLATCARTLESGDRDGFANCEACFGLYLDARPYMTTDLLTALQSLPDWLLDLAMLSPYVQSMLNVKISKRLPMMVIMVDLILYLVVMISYLFSVIDSVHDRNNLPRDNHMLGLTGRLAVLYVGATWFLFREILQAWGLGSLGLLSTWVSDWENILDLIYISIIFIWASVIATEAIEDIAIFQSLSAIFILPQTLVVLESLKSKFFGFAVFLGGMTYVLKRLTAFLISVMIIMIAFSNMFTTLYRQSEECKGSQTNPFSFELQNQMEYSEVYDYDCTGNNLDLQCVKNIASCEPSIDSPFCSHNTALTKILNMLGGEVDEENVALDAEATHLLARFYFILFVFVCVILLANVLIAIVTDSWAVMQNERAAMVFWSNRLDYVAEIDLTLNRFMRSNKRDAKNKLHVGDDYLREKWTQIIYLLENDVDDVDEYSEDKLHISNVVRSIAACVIIPLWVIVGFITFGALLPPQLREWMLAVPLSKMTKKNEEKNEDQTRLEEMNVLRENVASFRADVTANTEKGKSDLYMIRDILDTSQTEIQTEMNHVKELLSDMFDLLSPE